VADYSKDPYVLLTGPFQGGRVLKDMPEKTMVRAHRPGLSGRLASDRALADRIAGGDQAAFDEMFRRYQDPIYRFCAAMVGPDDGKDMLQNVMTKAMTSMPEKSDFQMKPWLYRVARNECIDHLRANRRVTGGLEADTEPDLAARTDPHRAVVGREKVAQLVEDLNGLPEKQRSSLVMREMSGLSYGEIAEGIGTSEAGAKQLVYEARLSLQQADLGRNLDCSEVRASISAMDRRRLRSRKVRAHMRSCRDCSEFERAISTREAGFRSLFPALPVGVAAGILGGIHQSAVSGGLGGAGATGSVAGGVASGLAVKGMVAVVIAGGIGAGTAEVIRHHERDQPASGREAPAPGARPAELVDGAGHAVVRPARPVPATEKAFSRTARPGSEDSHGTSSRPGDAGSTVTTGGTAPDGTPAVQGVADRITPGQGAGNGPAELPDASDQGQARAAQASSTKPGQTGAAPPSRKPAAPPGQTSENANQGKSESAPAVGRPESPGKSGK